MLSKGHENKLLRADAAKLRKKMISALQRTPTQAWNLFACAVTKVPCDLKDSTDSTNVIKCEKLSSFNRNPSPVQFLFQNDQILMYSIVTVALHAFWLYRYTWSISMIWIPWYTTKPHESEGARSLKNFLSGLPNGFSLAVQRTGSEKQNFPSSFSVHDTSKQATLTQVIWRGFIRTLTAAARVLLLF